MRHAESLQREGALDHEPKRRLLSVTATVLSTPVLNVSDNALVHERARRPESRILTGGSQPLCRALHKGWLQPVRFCSPVTAVAITGHSSNYDTTDRCTFSSCHSKVMGRTMFLATPTRHGDRLFATRGLNRSRGRRSGYVGGVSLRA